MLLAAGFMTLMTGSALAVSIYEKPFPGSEVMDMMQVNDLHDLQLIEEDAIVPPEGGEDGCVDCDEFDQEEEPIVDGGDEECVGCDQDLPDDGGDEGVVEDEETPPADDEQTPPADDEDQQKPPTTTDSGKKLPNTGTQLAIVGGIGLLAALTAYIASRHMKKRVR
ncbi:MAG: hypothetical protein C4534_09405 [Gaiellales bacterium]|nr:MAG: hypothetical protein C4534_09405 [Gaiellales bacterium]